MKTAFIMDMPRNCYECRFGGYNDYYDGGYVCFMKPLEFIKDDGTKAEWCPLRPLPEHKDIEPGHNVTSSREEGWREKEEPYAVIECATDEDYDALKEILDRSRWIPTTERLPEEEFQLAIKERGECAAVPVLASVQKRTVKGNTYIVTDRAFYFERYGVKNFHNDKAEPIKVLAWMPLPEPYKPEN